MTKVIFDINHMKIMVLFEAITQVGAKDCISDGSRTLFIVPEDTIARAIGRNGSNVKRLEKSLNKRVRIVEFSNNLHSFISKLAYPAAITNIEEKEGNLIITPADSKSRGILIGRGAKNLREFESIVKRYFKTGEIRVV